MISELISEAILKSVSEIAFLSLRWILGKSIWSSCIRFTFADLLVNRAHSIGTYFFGARELDISIYPWFALNNFASKQSAMKIEYTSPFPPNDLYFAAFQQLNEILMNIKSCKESDFPELKTKNTDLSIHDCTYPCSKWSCVHVFCILCHLYNHLQPSLGTNLRLLFPILGHPNFPWSTFYL